MALEPFQMEPSLDPETQYLVKRGETKELDTAIVDIEKQIQELEVRTYLRRARLVACSYIGLAHKTTILPKHNWIYPNCPDHTSHLA